MAAICSIKDCSNLVFRTDKLTRKRYCSNHWRQYSTDIDKRPMNVIAQEKANKSKLSPTTKSKIKGLGSKEDKSSYDSLDRWFKERMKTCEVKCENCGATSFWLEQNKDLKGKARWKSCQAHLLPKRHFESIMTHPLNGMVLGSGFSGLCNCHDNYDRSWMQASKMSIWDEVVRRFRILYPLIKEEEYQFIPDVLLQEINQI